MIVTEEEAKTKRCQEGYAASPGAARSPDTEYAVVHEPVYHSMSVSSAGAHAGIASSHRPATAPIFCLGSACMAWRWASEDMLDGMVGHGDVGYCGKAGRP